MEIKMVTCPNGHVYNAVIHAACPQCSGGSDTFGPTSTPLGGGPDDLGATSTPLGGGLGFSGYPRPGSGMGGTVGPTFDDGSGDPGHTVIGGMDEGFQQSSQEPVVGWLVCISGPMRGRDFRIRAGYNYIGRQTGDIILPDDNQVSRQKHAMIAYDSMDHTYVFGPVDGKNLVRVNNKTVFNAAEIHNYDVLTLGTSHLMFVGLCGSHFDWNEGRTNG